MEKFIELKDVCFEYKINGLETLTAVDHVTMSIPKASHIAILGRNGSGKSTLARLINGLEVPTSGEVFVDQIPLINERNAWEIRKKCGIVFQNPDNQIIGTTVEEDVAFGPENLGMSREKMIEEIDKALSFVGLQDKKRTAPHLLSGGQKQKLAIAGILAMSPDCCILDEATSMLDPNSRKELMKLVATLVQNHKMTVINITHHMEEAILADYVYIMSEGRVVREGSPEIVFDEIDLLKAEGLDVPVHIEITQVIAELSGIPRIPGNSFTPLSARDEINRICETAYLKNKQKFEKSGLNPNDYDFILHDALVETQPQIDTNTNINTNANSTLNKSAISSEKTNTNANTNLLLNTNTNTNTNANTSTNTNANANANANANTNTNTNTNTDANEKTSDNKKVTENVDTIVNLNFKTQNQPIIKVSNLSYTYAKETVFASDALMALDFDIYQGELFGIVGQAGSGKSTLVQHFNGLIRPQTGKVLVMGYDTSIKNSIRAIRKRAGLLFQYPEHQLFEETVYQDISFGPKCLGMMESEISAAVEYAISVVGLDSSILDKSPFELSGGQKRRVAIAGIVAMKPEILILDEPAAGLDPAGREEILQFMKGLCQSGTTVILVSHNMDDIARLADRILVLKKGRKMCCDAPSIVFDNREKVDSFGLSLPIITEFMTVMGTIYPSLEKNHYQPENCARAIIRAFCDARAGMDLMGGLK